MTEHDDGEAAAPTASDEYEDIEEVYEEAVAGESGDEADGGDESAESEEADEVVPGDVVGSFAESEAVGEVEADDVQLSEKTVITGGEFECELAMSREDTATFLRALAHQVETGHSLTVGTADWEIPFEYAEPIEVEVEHEGSEDEEPRELEIEVEFAWREGEGLSVR